MSSVKQKYINMYADSEGPDQTAQKCSLIRILTVAQLALLYREQNVSPMLMESY